MQISPGMMPAGLQAMQNGQRQMTEAAHAIANANQPTTDIADLTTQLMQMEQAKHMVEAGSKVIQTADETLGTLIDTTA